MLFAPSATRYRSRLSRAAGAATVALVFTCAASVLMPQPALSQGQMHMGGSLPTAKASLAAPPQMSSCTGCHGSNLQGRKGFSPNLTKLGVLKEYNQKTFERVMSTGVTNDGGHVQRPMPVYHFPKAVSDKIYAYLSSVKSS